MNGGRNSSTADTDSTRLSAWSRAEDLWREAMLPPSGEGVEARLQDIEARRAHFANWMTSNLRGGEGAVMRPADAGGVPAQWITASEGSATERTILYVHGGAFSLGSATSYFPFASRVGIVCDADVLLPEYRLAPEDLFPAALEDLMAVYRWLLQTNGVSAKNLVIVGDSAGGALALSLCLSLRDAGDQMPAALVLFSPLTDLEASGRSIDANASVDPVISRLLVLASAANLLGVGNPLPDVLRPLSASYEDFPPLLVQVGGNETLLDDSVRLVERYSQAQSDATLEIVESAPHVFQLFSEFIPEAQEALERTGSFVQRWSGAEQEA